MLLAPVRRDLRAADGGGGVLLSSRFAVSGPIPFGNYELIERIAEGGMAEVWRARSRGVAGFEKAVVIKRVLPALLERPSFAELLVREAKIAARLSHPNIVQIFDLGEQEGGYFIAMELLRGRDLAAALSYRGPGAEEPFSLPLRLWIGAEVAKALDYAHRAKGDDGKPLNIVHRDVSPQNVLLGFEGEVKVADFGIARADEAGLGRGEDPRILRGKYAYMSPEQARGQPLDRRSDIFSFGILLYELVTRRRMFRGKTSAETLELVRRADLPDYASVLPLPSLGPILSRALAPLREDRYGSAGEIHAELMRILFSLGEPVGQTDLAAAMHRMFPPADQVSPNKLRVDVLLRAYDDATHASDPGRTRPAVAPATEPPTESTRALPVSRRLRSDRRRLAFLAARARTGDERLFEAAVEGTGGSVLPPAHGLLLAVYGLAGMERAAGHATRGALELRQSSRLEGPARIDPSPAMAVLAGEGRVLEGVAVEPDPEVLERAAALLAKTEAGEIRVSGALESELGRDFRLRRRGPDDADVVVDGFRSRRDRDAGAMRVRAPLVGRRDVLRTLSGVLADTARGSGALVHLVGEPSVGKSRLLAELRAAAAPKDFVFVHGRADEADAERSFGALADLVSDLCGLEPEDTPAQRFEKVERMRVLGLAPREVRLLGELIGLAYPLASVERAGRPRGIEIALALRRALRTLADDRVVVLALEDLHWMDDATRQVLPLLVHGLTRARVLVLLTRRPGSSGPLPRGRTLEVPPLEVEAAGRLLAHWLGARAVEPELAELVHRETGGIPAWIEAFAEPLRAHVVVDDSVARLAPGAALPEALLPDAIRSVVAARIERLRPRDRSLLRAASALGGTVEGRVLGAIEGLVGHTERPALRRLLARRLLVADPVEPDAGDRLGAWGGDEEDERLPARVRVPSELLRRAVLAELDETELPRLHARIVATLERLGAGEDLEGLERLAAHAARALDRRRAPDYLLRAADVARAAGQHARASGHLARAAAILREERGDPADTEAFELGLRAAEAALRANALDLAEAALAPLSQAGSRADATLLVRRALAVADSARRRLAHAHAARALDEAREHLAAVDRALRIEALAALGAALAESGAAEDAVALLEQARREAAGDAQGRVLSVLASALARLDRGEEAHEAVSEALAMAARSGEGRLRYAALAAMAAVLEASGEPQAAIARCREAVEVGALVGEPAALASLSARAAALALSLGDDDEAAARAAEADRFAREARQEPFALVATAIRGALAVRAHPEATYVPGIVRAVERLEALEHRAEAAMAVEMLGFAHEALSDRAAAVRTLSRAAALAEGAGLLAYARRLRERVASLSAA